MKLTLLFAFSILIVTAFTQPVILNNDNIPEPGLSAPVSLGTPSAGVGSGGADQTWDFSSVIFTPVGTIDVIDPATSPIGASFPTANYAYSFAGNYSFFKVDADKLEVLAYVITTPGVGNDYTPNPRTNLIFPFNYLDTETDTWQKVGDSPNNVEISYDGYGTLITPSKTYTDVVRVKEDYGGGAIDYQWYILNPLMSIFIYDHNDNLLYNINADQITTGIENTSTGSLIDIYPNPASDQLNIELTQVESGKEMILELFNIYGQSISQYPVTNISTTINIQNIPSSVYIYQLKDKEGIVKTGKLIVE